MSAKQPKSSKSVGFKFSDKRGQVSQVWKHFQEEAGGQHAKCKEAGSSAILQHSGTTSYLHKHLRTKHNIVFERPVASSSTKCNYLWSSSRINFVC